MRGKELGQGGLCPRVTEASEQGSCPKNIERDGGEALTLGLASCKT